MGVETPKYRVAFTEGPERPGHGRAVRRVHRHGRRGQPRAQQGQGARQHLRPRDAGRARLPPGREALSPSSARRSDGRAPASKDIAGAHRGQEDPHRPHPPAAGRQGDARAAGRHRAGPARHQHRRVHQGLQREDGRQGRPDHPGPDHRLRGSHRSRSSSRRRRPPTSCARRPASTRAAATAGRENVGRVTRDQVREIANDQDDRPQRQRRRGGDAPGRGHRPDRWASRSSARLASPRASGRADRRPPDVHPTRRGRPDTPTASTRNRTMAHGKKYLEAAKLVDRETDLRPGRGGRARRSRRARSASTASVEVASPPRRRSAPRRPDGPRHGRPPARHRQDRPRRRLRPGREGAGSAPRPGPTRSAREDLVKKIEAGWLEFDVALATPDTMGQVGRLGKILGRRGPHAEPEVGHDHVRPRARDPRGQGRPGRVQGRQGGHRPRRRRQGQLRDRPAGRRTWPRSSTRSTGPSRPAPRASTCSGLTIASTMGPGIRVDVPGAARGRRRGLSRPAPRPYAATASGASSGRASPDNRRQTDRRRQPAPADRRDRSHRSGTGRSGLDPSDRTDRPQRPTGTTTSTPRQDRATSAVDAPLQTKDRRRGGSRVRIRPDARTHRRAPAARTEREVTHADRGQARDGRRAARRDSPAARR